jgi:hypothetical protein
MVMHRIILFGNPASRKNFGNPGTEEKVILKSFLRK